MRKKLAGGGLFLSLAGLIILFQADSARASSIVISQIYGGGGNTGGIYSNDFIELFNPGNAPASLAGWSVQYASATGTGNFGYNASAITLLPSITLAPGQYLLIEEDQGANLIASLPSPDVIDASPINLSLSDGKVALVNGTTSLGCNGGSTPCSPAELASIVDLVGYGGANFFEGASAAPVATNATAILRRGGGLQDTGNNGADFIAGTPNPRNMASPFNVPIPEPATLSFLGIGIVGLIAYGWRHRRRQ